jgi:hypothetical protein
MEGAFSGVDGVVKREARTGPKPSVSAPAQSLNRGDTVVSRSSKFILPALSTRYPVYFNVHIFGREGKQVFSCTA